MKSGLGIRPTMRLLFLVDFDMSRDVDVRSLALIDPACNSYTKYDMKILSTLWCV